MIRWFPELLATTRLFWVLRSIAFGGAICFLTTATGLAASGDEHWSTRFHQPILTRGSVGALAANSNDLVVAGTFFEPGGVSATNIARWNGTNWMALGTGLQGTIDFLSASESMVYAAGAIILPGRSNAVQLARWDGTNWASIESGLAYVSAMVAHQDLLFLAGGATNLAGEWWFAVSEVRGTSRTTIGVATNGYATSMAVRGRELFVAGILSSVNEVSVTNVARWDGTNWSGVGSGVIGAIWVNVRMMATDERGLYVGGDFTNAGSQSITNLARWDGTNWWPMTEGISFPTNGSAVSLIAGGGVVYLSGIFDPDQPERSFNYARWDGARWQVIPTVLGLYPTLAANNHGLFVKSYFEQIGAQLSTQLARWNGMDWSGLSGDFITAGSVKALAVLESDVVLGGDFHHLGGFAASNLARWDRTNLAAFGTGANGPVVALAASGRSLYAAGDFTYIGGIQATGVAGFDGTNWFPLAGGIDFSPIRLAVEGTNLFAGGPLRPSETPPLSIFGIPRLPSGSSGGSDFVVCRWGGTGWELMLGTNVGWYISSLAEIVATTSNLFVLGSVRPFDPEQPNSIPMSNSSLAWDGTQWSFVGDIPCCGASGGTGIGDKLRLISGGTALSELNGTNLTKLGETPFSSPSAMTVSQDDVYVGSRGHPDGFPPTGPDPRGLIMFDGLDWRTLGSGVNGSVHALAARGDEVFVAGDFSMAGGKPSHGFAIWQQPPPELALRITKRLSYYPRSSGFGWPCLEFLISWPAAFSNQRLEEANEVAPLNWHSVLQEPAVAGSRRVVTNLVALPLVRLLPSANLLALTNTFFRLRQP